MMLDRARVTENENKIRDVYLEKGYFLADVDSEIKISDDGFSAEVLFRITENEKVMVRSLDLVGNTAILDSKLSHFFKPKRRPTFRRLPWVEPIARSSFRRTS